MDEEPNGTEKVGSSTLRKAVRTILLVIIVMLAAIWLLWASLSRLIERKLNIIICEAAASEVSPRWPDHNRDMS